jgi:AMP-activated protein kinase-like protein
MSHELHPLVKLLLDGELRLSDLPPELKPEGERALRLLEAVDRAPVALSAQLDDRVMTAVRARAASRWRWLVQPRELRIHVRPWTLVPALAAAAALVFVLVRPTAPSAESVATIATAPESVTVRLVLHAPDAQRVAVAGSFNQWNAAATPLLRSGTGVWTATLTLPVGQHQYAFVVDGIRWVPDPSAPGVDDGFGRRNSVLAL